MAVSLGDSIQHRASSAGHNYVNANTVEVQRHFSDIALSKTNCSSPYRMKKAKRIQFLCNGDRFNKGVVMAVAPERYRSFDSLLGELTRVFSGNINLPSGVRTVFAMDGSKIFDLDDLEDGKQYVCSSYSDQFKKVDYLRNNNNRVRPARSLTKLQNCVNTNNGPISNISRSLNVARPRIVILIRNGTRPRRVLRLLLNKRNAPSFEHALTTITDAVKLDTGAVRKVFDSRGNQLSRLEEFFVNEEDCFFVYGSERISSDDFDLDFEELKAVQAQKKGLRRPGNELKNGTHYFDETTGKKVPKLPNANNKDMKTNGLKKAEPTHVIPSKVLNRYSIGPVIGEGNFAVVRRCSDKLKGIDYALKIIDKSKITTKHMFDNEVTILRSVEHTNIIRLVSEYDTPSELYLIMELVTGGDLFDAISKRIKFSEPDAQIMTHDLASALAYLHDNMILHRDIKPENLLVEMDGDCVRLLKVADFGLAQRVTGPLYTVCGTPTYVAPEILTEVGYGLKIDVWAAGVILYILLCGFPPFVSSNNDQEELFDDILSGQYGFPSPYWNDISDSAKDLITHMLQLNPSLRFSAEDVLDHPWLENV